MAQWLGIHLPMQGDTGSIPGLGRFHVPLGKWACAPLQLSPSTLEPVLRNKRSHCNEKPVQCTATETQCSQEKKKKNHHSECLSLWAYPESHQDFKRPSKAGLWKKEGLPGKGLPGNRNVSWQTWVFTTEGQEKWEAEENGALRRNREWERQEEKTVRSKRK